MQLPKCGQCNDPSAVSAYMEGIEPEYLCVECSVRMVRVAPVKGLLLTIHAVDRATMMAKAEHDRQLAEIEGAGSVSDNVDHMSGEEIARAAIDRATTEGFRKVEVDPISTDDEGSTRE